MPRTMTWNHEADARLFMQVLKIHNVKLDYNALAQAMGPDVTAKAIVHRIAKIRAVAVNDSAFSSSQSPAKSKKRGRPAGTKGKAAKQDASHETTQDDDENAEGMGDGQVKCAEDDSDADLRKAATKRVNVEVGVKEEGDDHDEMEAEDED